MKRAAKEEYPDRSIYERDNFTCQYCGASGLADFGSWWRAHLTIDHVKPRKHGGSKSDPLNLVVSCRNCNNYKGQRDCNTFAEAKSLVDEKRREAQEWFVKHVEARKPFTSQVPSPLSQPSAPLPRG